MADLRVVLADDNVLIREGVAAIIASLDGIQLVARCEDVDQLHDAVDSIAPTWW